MDDVRRAVRKRNTLVLRVVDATDVEGSLAVPRERGDDVGGADAHFAGLLGPSPLVLVLTKMDRLPEGWSARRLESWLRERVAHASWASNVAAVLPVSSRSGKGMGRFRDLVRAEYAKRTGLMGIHIVGTPNAGKSLLVNRLCSSPHAALVHDREGSTTAVRNAGVLKGTGIQVWDTPGLPLGASLRMDETQSRKAQDKPLQVVRSHLTQSTALRLTQWISLRYVSGPKIRTATFFPNRTRKEQMTGEPPADAVTHEFSIRLGRGAFDICVDGGWVAVALDNRRGDMDASTAVFELVGTNKVVVRKAIMPYEVRK